MSTETAPGRSADRRALTLSGAGGTFLANGGVAKLVIALACQAGGRGFKSRRSRIRFHHAAVPAGTAVFVRAVAQMVARSVRDRKAGGSNPPSPTPLQVE